VISLTLHVIVSFQFIAIEHLIIVSLDFVRLSYGPRWEVLKGGLDAIERVVKKFVFLKDRILNVSNMLLGIPKRIKTTGPFLVLA
jgi:hypothetical protein